MGESGVPPGPPGYFVTLSLAMFTAGDGYHQQIGAANKGKYMKPEQVSNTTRKGIKLRKPTIKLAILVALLLALISVGLYLYGERKTSNIAQLQSLPLLKQEYTYKQLNDYKLQGEKDGSGFTFSKPVEISSPDIKSDTRLQQNSFWHSSVNNGRVINIANMAVASAYTKDAPTKEYIKSLQEEANDAENDSPIGSKAAIKMFLEQRMPGYATTLSQPKSLVTDNIKENAWTVEFTAKAKDTKYMNGLPNIKGVGVMALGKSTYYYLFINTVDYNWDSNQDTWQKVLNSIKIDQ